MDREKRARENFCGGLNCGQSVFMAFADLTGLTDEQAMKLSAPFGGGMGGMGGGMPSGMPSGGMGRGMPSGAPSF